MSLRQLASLELRSCDWEIRRALTRDTTPMQSLGSVFLGQQAFIE